MPKRRLFDLDIDEVSIVDFGANKKKKFHILKRRKTMKKLIEVLKGILGEETIEDSSVEKLKAIPEDKVEEIRKSLEEITEYQENFPPTLEEAFLSLVKNATYDYPVKESEPVFDFEDMEKAGKKFSKSTIEQLEKIRDLMISLIGKKEDKEKKAGLDKLPQDLKDKLREREELLKEREEQRKADQQKKDDKIAKQEKEIAKLKKQAAKKTGLDDQDDDDDNDVSKKEDPWPSLEIGKKD